MGTPEHKEPIRISLKKLKPNFSLMAEVIVSAIVIVAVIFSAMLLVVRQRNEHIEKANLAKQADAVQAQTSSAPTKPCALNTEDIAEGSKVTFPILVSGTIDPTTSHSCGWVLFEGVAGNIKIMDHKGNVIAGTEQIKLEDAWLDLFLLKKPIHWSALLNQVYIPQTIDGMIRFESPSQADGSISYRFDLPVKF